MLYSITAIVLLAVVSCLVIASSSTENLVVVRQDNTTTGFIEEMCPKSGKVMKHSSTKFVFDWPLVEMTADTNTNDIYTVTYPEGYPGPVLYHLDHNLELIYSWVNTPYSFFDLQYSSVQSAMYGILVTTTYGRALSNFTLDQPNDSITTKELYTLPYMWYVNASSFDQQNCRYFALINNFPGFDNSTLDQQLVVGDFSQDSAVTGVAPPTGLFQISSADLLLVFVSYSHATNTLFCSGITKETSIAQIGILDETTGKVQSVKLFEKAATAVGPLMVVPAADGASDLLTFFVQTHNNPLPVWELYSITVGADKQAQGKAQLVNTYVGNNYTFFAGATTTI